MLSTIDIDSTAKARLGRPKQFGVLTKDMPPKEPVYDVQKLQSQHREMLRLLAAGYKVIEVARHLGVCITSVYKIRRSTLGSEKLAELQDSRDHSVADITEALRELAPSAISVLDACLQPDIPPSIRLAAAKDTLDRSGFGAVSKNVSLTGNVTSADIDNILDRVASMDKVSTSVKEVKIEDSSSNELGKTEQKEI